MGLEQRVETLELRHGEWDKILLGLEGTLALTLKKLMNVERKQEAFELAVEKRFDQMDRRFNQLEMLIRENLHTPTN